MPTFSLQTFSSYFKRILQVSQTTNAGVDATTRAIETGDGAKTSISLSDDVLSVQPISDNTTGTMIVKNQAGSSIFSVDTQNSKLLGGASQTPLNTQYEHFGVDQGSTLAWIADTYFAVPFGLSTSATTYTPFGSSTSSSFNDTEPATSLTLTGTGSATASYWPNMYWYVMDDITIDAVKWLHGADADAGDSTAAYLMGYSADLGNGSTSGDLTSGVKLASSPTITNAGDEQIYYDAMTIHSANVDAGSVILFFFASDTVNSDYSINANISFHIR